MPSKDVLSKSSFALNVAAMAGGTTFASALLVISEPITSRMFSPEVFGMVSAFYSAAAILGMIACLRYEMALVLPSQDEDAGNIFALSSFILVLVTGLVTLASYVFGRKILRLLNMEVLSPSLWIFPLAVFFTGLEQLLRRWQIRYKRFRNIALSRTMQAIPRVIAEVGGGSLGFTGGNNLVFLRIFSLIGPLVNLSYSFIRRDLFKMIKICKAAGMINNARRYIKFPLFEAMSSLFLVISFNSPTILLSSFFGPDSAGFYAKAFYLLYMPTLILGEATSQAFFQMSAEKLTMGKELKGLVEAVVTRMMSFGVLPFAILGLAGPDLFKFALGPWWSEAGIYAQIICPWMFVVLLNNAISTLFNTLERQGIGLFFNFLLASSRLLILFMGGLIIRDPHITLVFFSYSSLLIIVWRCSYLIKAVKASHLYLIKHFVRNILMVVPTLAIIAWVKWGLHAGPKYVCITAVIASLPYVIMAVRLDPELRAISLGLFQRLDFFGKR